MPGVHIKIEPRKLADSAEVIQREKDNIRNRLQDIEAACREMQTFWEGESASFYQDAMAKFNAEAPEIDRVFGEYISDLRETSGLFETLADTVSANAAQLPTDIFS